MLAVAVRIAIRLWHHKRFHLDDYFLLSSCVCLIAATGLLYHGVHAIFFTAELSFNPVAVINSGLSQADILREVVFFQKINWTYLSLSWTSIFAIKFGFLAFFRHLVDRIPFMYRYWKTVTQFTALVFVFSVCDSFIACSKLGLAVRERLMFSPVNVLFLTFAHSGVCGNPWSDKKGSSDRRSLYKLGYLD